MEAQKGAAAEIKEDFISVVNRETAIDGIGLCVPLEAYRKVLANEPDARIFLQDRHFYFAYHTLMIELIKRCEKDFKNHWVAFVCDDHSRRDEAEAAYEELKEKNPRSAKRMGSMTHADDKAVLPLQMADLIAYEARRAMLYQLQHRPVSKNDAMSKLSESIYFMGHASENYLREAIRDLIGQRKERDGKQE
jgi:hypothetical protein